MVLSLFDSVSGHMGDYTIPVVDEVVVERVEHTIEEPIELKGDNDE